MYKLVFQNKDFIIVDKDVNVLTVPSRMGRDDNRPCLGIKLGHDFKTKIMPVHRLDFEVSGLVMFATNFEAQRSANLWFEKKQIFKTYEAKSIPINQNFKFNLNEVNHWECMLMKGKKRAYEAEFGKKSITEATLINIDAGNIHTWILNPITGRSHQLRFELFRHGHPILGDELYGSTVKLEKGIALRSNALDLSNCPDREKYNLPKNIKI